MDLATSESELVEGRQQPSWFGTWKPSQEYGRMEHQVDNCVEKVLKEIKG